MTKPVTKEKRYDIILQQAKNAAIKALTACGAELESKTEKTDNIRIQAKFPSVWQWPSYDTITVVLSYTERKTLVSVSHKRPLVLYDALGIVKRAAEQHINQFFVFFEHSLPLQKGAGLPEPQSTRRTTSIEELDKEIQNIRMDLENIKALGTSSISPELLAEREKQLQIDLVDLILEKEKLLGQKS